MTDASIFMYWNSYVTGTIFCFEDQDKTVPMNLEDKSLTMIAKRRISDDDTAAVFVLTLAGGELVLEDTPDRNKISFTIPPAGTLELPRAKNTTIWCELLANPDDEDSRQTIEQFPLPVKPSVKDATEP